MLKQQSFQKNKTFKNLFTYPIGIWGQSYLETGSYSNWSVYELQKKWVRSEQLDWDKELSSI